MAMAVRALARRAAGKAFQHLSTPALSSTSCAIGESLLLRSSPSFPVTHPGSSHAEEIAKFRGMPHLSLSQSSRVYSTGANERVVEEAECAIVEDKEQPNSVIKSPPRPFRLTPAIRTMAEEVGYKVIDRYTEEDFGRNKKPKAFAVVQIGSHQFKVSPNDIIYTEKLKYCDINDKLMLGKVLLLGTKTQTVVGRPVVPKSAVFAVVEEHALDEKVIIFKKKRRKNYRRTTGHRQELTRLRILDIKGIDLETTPLVKIEKSSRVEENSSPAPEKVEVATPILA